MSLTKDEKKLLGDIREDQAVIKTDIKWIAKEMNGLGNQVRSNTKKINVNRIILAIIIVGGGGGIAGLVKLLT